MRTFPLPTKRFCGIHYMTMHTSNHLQLEHICIHIHVDRIAKDVVPITLHGVKREKQEVAPPCLYLGLKL